MFADEFQIKLGGVDLKGRRLTIRELKADWDALMNGRLDVEKACGLIREHVIGPDGKKIDPEELSVDQLRALVAEITLPKEGRGIADFIGLLC